jgi:hypothetical protein
MVRSRRSQKLRLAPVQVPLLRGDLFPAISGLGHQFIQVLPLLFVVVDDTSEAVGEIVAVEGQVQPILVGKLRQNPGLVFLAYVQERLEPVGLAGRSRIATSSRIRGAPGCEASGGILTSCHRYRTGLPAKPSTSRSEAWQTWTTPTLASAARHP